MSLLQHHKSLLPVLVTIVEGPERGYTCVFYGKDELRKYFHYSRVKWAIRQKQPYKRCLFSYLPFIEAKQFPKGMPDDIAKTLTCRLHAQSNLSR